MKKIILSAIATFFITLLTGCGGGGSGGNTTPTPTPVTLTSIAITPASTTVAKGKTANLTAVGTYSNATTANLTSQVTWLSANPAVATINSTTGVATSVTVGNTNITASLNGVTSAAANLSVTAAVITGLTISPSALTTPKGVAVTFTATGTYSDGTTGNASASVIWTSSATTVATLNTSGIASSFAQGTTSVTASANGVSSNVATLTVTAPALTAIAINPASATFAKGLTSSFTATGTYTDATTANITNQVTWVSANPAVATIGNTTGIATGVALGSTTVSASLAGITAPAVGAAVTAAVIKSISITPTAPSIAKGLPVTFTATGTYSDGTAGNISGAVTWVSSSPTVAALNTSGIASSLAQGVTSVTATTNGLTSNAVTLTVTAPALVSLAITPLTPSIMVGSTQQFAATGVLTDATAASLGALTWVSSGTTVATVNTTGLVTALAVGSTNITASSGGITSNAVVLSVTPPPVGTQMGGARQGVVPALTNVVSTLAGSGAAGLVNGMGIAASFNQPNGITTDGTNLYVADNIFGLIRKVVISTGVVTTVAGMGNGGCGAVDGIGIAAAFCRPYGMTTDGTNLYVTDNSKIRKIVIATGAVTTLAIPVLAYSGITTDGTNLYATVGNTITKIVLATNVVTTLAGSGTGASVDGTGIAASFNMPTSVTTDGTNLYVTDWLGGVVRKVVISSGVVTTIPATFASPPGATFTHPNGITTDGTNLYLTDGSSACKIVIATGAASTLVIAFGTPYGITTDGVALYIADVMTNKISKIQ